jgi:hypothetical protein
MGYWTHTPDTAGAPDCALRVAGARVVGERIGRLRFVDGALLNAEYLY